MGSNKLLADLNTQQIEAILNTEGYIRVIAGAGSGKTRTLTRRYAYLVSEIGISPSSILCVTFTNKAAGEMKSRIRTLIGDMDLGYITTFHGFGVRFITEEHNFFQYPQRFIVLDNEDTKTILKNCFSELNLTSKDLTFKAAEEFITFRKSSLDYIDILKDISMEKILEKRRVETSLEERVYTEYLYNQRKLFGLDFNDLINLTFYALVADQDICEKWQKRFEYILVDEFQDVSSKEYQIVSILGEFHRNLFVVGDPDQTIYSWRGANVRHILDFDKDFPTAKTIIMDLNYRSSRRVIASSNSLIDKNRLRVKKKLIPYIDSEGFSIYFHAKTQAEEAQWIAAQILSLRNQGIQFSDISILYRAHYVSRSIEEEFLTKEIPYTLYSGVPFYSRKEIKDTLSYLRLIISADDLSFIRVINEPKRGIGKTRLKRLVEYGQQNYCSLLEALEFSQNDQLFLTTEAHNFLEMLKTLKDLVNELSITDLLAQTLHLSGYEELLRREGDVDRLDNLSELKRSIYEFETTSGEDCSLEDYLNQIALFTNMDIADKGSTVKMMTIHSAKGLEFPYVFVCGLNEGIFPSARTNTYEKLEEERRLAFVAYSRAMNGLFLTDSEGRNYDGSMRYPSRFIFNTERVNLDYVVDLPEELVAETYVQINTHENRLRPKKLLNVGDRIRHSVFGAGSIEQVDEEKSCYLVQFDSVETQRSISFSLFSDDIGDLPKDINE